MADAVPVLLGTAGFVLGECFVLGDGSDVVIGRSRSCDISLRRAANYLKAASETRDVDQDFNTVSRRHLRLQVHESVVRVQDLSTNGTFCNDDPVQQAREIDLANGAFSLRLGTRETFQVQMLPKDDPRVIVAGAREPQAAGPKTPAP
ncbi:MAG: FHA domain-containing protein [Planctomycetes bacterium]|nr:FHA domain-containing protein [Planctomycetota bacterium]